MSPTAAEFRSPTQASTSCLILQRAPRVHIVRAIVTREQNAERGEWITEEPFTHSIVTIADYQIAELETHFARLAELAPWVNVTGYAPDYEEAVRRLLRFRAHGLEIRAFLPRRSLWDSLGVTRDGVDAFNAAWCAVWRCIGTPKDIEISTPVAAQD